MNESNPAAASLSLGSGGKVPTQDLRASDLCHLLPALPYGVRELNRILSSDPVDLNQLGKACASDPNLAARIIGLSNSSLFALAQPVSRVEQAVMVVGADRLRVLALACHLVECIGERLSLHIEQYFWRRAFPVAALSQRIAQWTGYPDVEMAYLAGLLHDVGVLPLLIFASRQETARNTGSLEADFESVEAERLRFGVDHCELGRAIGDLWNFPAPVLEVFEFHEEPHRALCHSRLVRVVAAASKLARAFQARGGGRPASEGGIEAARHQQLLRACLGEMNPRLLVSLADALQMDYREVDRWIEARFSKAFCGPT